jgi:hypothetical protein
MMHLTVHRQIAIGKRQIKTDLVRLIGETG